MEVPPELSPHVLSSHVESVGLQYGQNRKNLSKTEKTINRLFEKAKEELGESITESDKELLKKLAVKEVKGSESGHDIYKGFEALTLNSDQKKKILGLFAQEKSKQKYTAKFGDAEYRTKAMETAALGLAYYEYKEGDEIPYFKKIPVEEDGISKTEKPTYVVHKVIKDDRGFHAMIVKPKELKWNEDGKLLTRPMLLFRGSSSAGDFWDDFQPELGAEGMKDNLNKIDGSVNECITELQTKAEKEERTNVDIRFDVAGHSLGGNRAQRYVAKHPGKVYAVYTFQSPGVGDKVCLEYKTNIESLGDDKKPKIVHVEVFGKEKEKVALDKVTRSGGRHLEGTYVYTPSIETKNPLEIHGAERLPTERDHKKAMRKKTKEFDDKTPGRGEELEGLRRLFGPMIVFLLEFFCGVKKTPENLEVASDKELYQQNPHAGG